MEEPKQEKGAMIYTGTPEELAVLVVEYMEARHEVALKQFKENLTQFLTNHPVHRIEAVEEYVWDIYGGKPEAKRDGEII